MKLRQVILTNFRGYRDEARIEISDLTAFIGENDVGKSTILEALEIFFNSNQIKIDPSDACVHGDKKNVRIGCAFEILEDDLIIDSSARTTLAGEYLLNEAGLLEVYKTWDLTKPRPKEGLHCRSNHPTVEKARDLLQLKISDLKTRAKEIGVNEKEYNAAISNSIRTAIRNNLSELKLDILEIPLQEGGAKDIWDSLKQELPVFALFRSDRPSTDKDAEFQDPMKVAVDTALKSVEKELEAIKNQVKQRATEVATRTVEKLNEMAPDIAKELEPHFEEPKWSSSFKLSLTGDDQIPINKRGSGTRRLILINFFRAEAERKLKEKNQELKRNPRLIYAIEEPETSQHPNNQRMLIEALMGLAESGETQVLLTTHVPGLASLLPTDCIRHVVSVKNDVSVLQGEDILGEVAISLGVLPDAREFDNVRVVVFVEGPRDIEFLSKIFPTLHAVEPEIFDFTNNERVILLPLGGQTLKDWVFNNYLERTGLTEIHIYDRGKDTPPKFQDAAREVNERDDASRAFLTRKNETENYIHPEAIMAVRGLEVTIDDDTDVPELVARLIHEASPDSGRWEDLSREVQKQKMRKAKIWLNTEAAEAMTYEQIIAVDSHGEFREWQLVVQQALKIKPDKIITPN